MMTVEMLRPIFARAWKYWNEDQVPRHAAALTFYMMLAMSPLLLFLAAAGTLLLQSHGGENELQRHLLASIRHTMGPEQASFLKNIIQNGRSKSAGYAATAVGLVVTLFGASGLFQQVRGSANDIWRAKSPEKGIKGFLVEKMFAVLMVLLIGVVLIGWLGLDSWLHLVNKSSGGGFAMGQVLSFILGCVFWCLVDALLFKWIPERKLAWRDVWAGAIFTSVAFSAAQYLLGLYFSYSSISVSYGSAGAIVIMLLWGYYCSQIFFYGMEITRAYAEEYGTVQSRVADHPAVQLTPETAPSR